MYVDARSFWKVAIGALAIGTGSIALATDAAAQKVPPGYDGRSAVYKVMIGSNLRSGDKLTDKIMVTLWQGGDVKGSGACTDQACPVSYNGQELWARRSRLTVVTAGAGGMPPPSKPGIIEKITDKIGEKVGKSQITRILRLGDEGEDVRYLQETLNSKFGAQLSVDGKYGRATKAFVADYQRSKGLQPDGNTGPDTLNSMGI